MTHRIHNFNAGPAAMPLAVLEEIQAEFLDFKGSGMNVTFRLPSEDLEARFVKESLGEGLGGLKGHRSVGGCRASLYNATGLDAVKALVSSMEAFEKKNG